MTQEKTNKEPEKIKRGYDYPVKLLDLWEEFHKERLSKNYSPSASGAMILWLAMPAALRDETIKAAQRKDLNNAIKDLRECAESQLLDSKLVELMREYVDGISDRLKSK